jgi:hypothetical protein
VNVIARSEIKNAARRVWGAFIWRVYILWIYEHQAVVDGMYVINQAVISIGIKSIIKMKVSTPSVGGGGFLYRCNSFSISGYFVTC